MENMAERQPKANVSRLKRIGGLRFLYNRQIYHSAFYDDEVEEPPQQFIYNLRRVLKTLNEKEQRVLALRYIEGKPKSLAQIGRGMGVSKERIRQIETRALRKLMQPARTQTLGIVIKRKSRYQS